MQFNFNVNEVLPSSMTILDNKSKLGYVPYGTDSKTIVKMSRADQLCYIIDEMGRASALAQGLPRAITTSSKLKHSDHRLYLLKVDLDGGDSEVVGMLKVGYKTLFVYDIQSHHHELQPLCVLDFYVHESKQRQGYGRILFDWMLQSEDVLPHHIAIDRPSPKFSLFLAKHYQMTDMIPQLNNFVVFIDFFNNRPDASVNHNQKRHHRHRQRDCHASVKTQSLLTPVMPVCTAADNTANTNTNSGDNKCVRRRTQSSTVTQGRPHVNIDSLHLGSEQHQQYIISNVDSVHRVEPLLPRGAVAADYKAMLSSSPLSLNSDTVKTEQHRSMGSTAHNSGAAGVLLQSKGQLCGRSRKDYNYSVGLARHYSHTRLW